MGKSGTKYDPPRPTAKDIVHSAVRAGVSLVPVVGSPALEFFNSVLAPPVEKRRQEWMEAVADGLRQLEADGRVKLADLSDNEAFVSTVMHATQAAQRNHQQEKLDALRNAVLNSALPGAPDDSLQQMFVGWVDRFTEWHLRLLTFLADPPGWFRGNGRPVPQFMLASNMSQVLTDAFPALQAKRSFYDQIIRELIASGLVGDFTFHAVMSGGGWQASRTTEEGNRFLRFITAPTIPRV